MPKKRSSRTGAVIALMSVCGFGSGGGGKEGRRGMKYLESPSGIERFLREERQRLGR
jgi:hypothetical protein